jgi:AcrR family transcriptional regulator
MAAVNAKTKRARPLAPDERRQAILDAVIPLLLEQGATVTTAAMAEAAGIAEGTIFGVFPDKAALLYAAFETTMDPAAVVASLAAIDSNSPIDTQLETAAGALAQHFENVTAFIGMLRSMPHHAKPHADAHRVAQKSMAAIAESLTQLMETHSSQLAVDPAQAALVLRGLVFTNTHRMLTSESKMATDQLVSILLNGVLRAETN